MLHVVQLRQINDRGMLPLVLVVGGALPVYLLLLLLLLLSTKMIKVA